MLRYWLLVVGVILLVVVGVTVLIIRRAKRAVRTTDISPPDVQTTDFVIKLTVLTVPVGLALFNFLLTLVVCKNLVTGAILGAIVAGFVIFVCFNIVTSFAMQNCWLTRMEEATAKVVYRLGRFSKILFLFSGHEKLTEEQAKALNVVDKDKRDYPYDCSAGDIIELKRLSKEQKDAWDECRRKEPPLPWYVRLVDSAFIRLGGLQVIGIPGIDELHVWTHKEFSIEETTEGSSDGRRMVLKEAAGPEEKREYLRLRDMPLPFLLRDMETARGYGDQQGIAPSMNVGAIFFVRVVNVFRSTIMLGDWRTGLQDIVLPYVRETVAETTPTDLYKSRTFIARRIIAALHGQATKWKCNKKRTRIIGIEQEASSVAPDASGNDTALSEVLYRYGIEIRRAEIGSTEFTDPEMERLYNSPATAEQEAIADINRAKGEAGRLKQMMEQAMRHPALAQTLLTTDAVTRAKGTTFLTVGSPGAGTLNEQTQLLQGILATLQGKPSKSEKPEAEKGGERKS
ncbi:MAG: SPFH domain-containing protein [Patescibacteria group bacterium]|nr:SPFH domain-containing protein [Patescibacteria group bacterium]